MHMSGETLPFRRLQARYGAIVPQKIGQRTIKKVVCSGKRTGFFKNLVLILRCNTKSYTLRMIQKGLIPSENSGGVRILSV
jgi:hypothetical protein